MEETSRRPRPKRKKQSSAHVTVRITTETISDNTAAGEYVARLLADAQTKRDVHSSGEEYSQADAETTSLQQETTSSASREKETTQGTTTDVASSVDSTLGKEDNPDDAFIPGATIISGIFAGISLLGVVAMGMFNNLRDSAANPYMFIFAGGLISIILLFVASLTSAESGRTYINCNIKGTLKKFLIWIKSDDANVICYILAYLGLILIGACLIHSISPQTEQEVSPKLSSNANFPRDMIITGVIIWGVTAVVAFCLRFIGTFTYKRIFFGVTIWAMIVIFIIFIIGALSAANIKAIEAQTTNSSDSIIETSSERENDIVGTGRNTTYYPLFNNNFTFVCNIQKVPANTGR